MRAAFAIIVCAACGRLEFDALTGDHPSPDGATGDAMSDGPSAVIAYVAPSVQRDPGTGPTDTFTARPHAAGNAIVIQVSCAANAVPTAVSVTSPGWTFTQLGGITASASSLQRSATVVAIAPNTDLATIRIAWTGSTCNDSKNHVGGEFGMTAPGGHANEVVWAACNSDNSVNAVGQGFTKGADDGAGDWSEYKVTTDPAGTVESVRFRNDNVGYVLSMVTIVPQ
jgi:hypothetical protein